MRHSRLTSHEEHQNWRSFSLLFAHLKLHHTTFQASLQSKEKLVESMQIILPQISAGIVDVCASDAGAGPRRNTTHLAAFWLLHPMQQVPETQIMEDVATGEEGISGRVPACLSGPLLPQMTTQIPETQSSEDVASDAGIVDACASDAGDHFESDVPTHAHCAACLRARDLDNILC